VLFLFYFDILIKIRTLSFCESFKILCIFPVTVVQYSTSRLPIDIFLKSNLKNTMTSEFNIYTDNNPIYEIMEPHKLPETSSSMLRND